MFYITISNGLLEGNHQERMGAAVWQFMWLIDKVTWIDEDGWGWVLGGKPIKLEDLAQCVSRDTISRNLHRLDKMGYISLKRTPAGLLIKVAKAKKGFGKNVESDLRKMSNPIKTVAVRQEDLYKSPLKSPLKTRKFQKLEDIKRKHPIKGFG